MKKLKLLVELQFEVILTFYLLRHLRVWGRISPLGKRRDEKRRQAKTLMKVGETNLSVCYADVVDVCIYTALF